MIAGHRVGHYSAQGAVDAVTKEQVKAVVKTLRGKVTEQTFPLNLQIPQTTRDSHFLPPLLRLTLSNRTFHLFSKADISTC